MHTRYRGLLIGLCAIALQAMVACALNAPNRAAQAQEPGAVQPSLDVPSPDQPNQPQENDQPFSNQPSLDQPSLDQLSPDQPITGQPNQSLSDQTPDQSPSGQQSPFPSAQTSPSASPSTSPFAASAAGAGAGGAGQVAAGGTGFASTPNMIGDLFGGAGLTRVFVFNRRQIFPGQNPFNPDNPVGTNVEFSGFTGGILALPTTVQSQLTTAALNAQPNVDTPGSTFALNENAAMNADFQASFLQQGQVTNFVNANAALMTEGGTGISPADLYDLNFTYDVFDVVFIAAASPGSGGIVGRTKITEDNSPIPRDRYFFNYNSFFGVPIGTRGMNLHRFTPGFETTFNCGASSIEARFPFASTLNSDVIADGTNTSNLEFGNFVTTFKHILYERSKGLISGGIAVSLPTSDDVKINLANGTSLVRIDNESVHLLPFLGWLYAPNPSFFLQGFVQADVDVSGVPVFLNPDQTSLRRIGRIYDRTYLYADAAIGYWIYRAANACGPVHRIASIVELHYNRSLEDGEIASAGNFAVGDVSDSFELLNFVAGLNFFYGEKSTLTVGYTTPLGSGTDREFNHEIRVLFNQYWGGRGVR